ncbi:unnamed protein product [Cochlearia groenlandica]
MLYRSAGTYTRTTRKVDPYRHVVSSDKGKGKVTGDEPSGRRTRSGSVVIREPTDEVPREEPRRSESRRSNARRRRRNKHAVVEEEKHEYVLESEPEEEEAPRGFTFPPRTSETPLVRDPKKPPLSLELYDALMEISFVPSRFPDPDTLRKLGIYDEVREILRHMRLDGVLRMKYNTYKEETCQFLATLEVILDEPGSQGAQATRGETLVSRVLS